MFKKVLIANRGEIAVRIIRAAHELGLKAVAVFSDADAKALHVTAADEAVHIGRSPAAESYLRIDKIIAAAKDTSADCIHPGYGFLAENAEFAEACIAARIKFIGPSPDAMRLMGAKAGAKTVAEAAGLPIIPGYHGKAQGTKALAAQAAKIGYPLMIKAVLGGGGRGMRAVAREADFAAALESAQREAAAAFGDAEMLLEKLIQNPRHIEVQVFGDAHGNVVHMFERDCSLQRRHQKVIEEAPAPGMSQGLRAKMTSAAITLARSASYEGAGTVEFLVEGGSLGPDAPFYFLEMNTRLQVEHPVTEEVTGIDLVQWQFRVAAGEKLPLRQDEIKIKGHAIEARLYAEDPARGFMPSSSATMSFGRPYVEGVRVEAGIDGLGSISPYYDSMIAKIIAHGSDRKQAIALLRRAFEETTVWWITTNGSFLQALIASDDMGQGKVDTGLVERCLDDYIGQPFDDGAVAWGLVTLLNRNVVLAPPVRPHNLYRGPWDYPDAFQLGPDRVQTIPIDVDGKRQCATLSWQNRSMWVSFGSARMEILIDDGAVLSDISRLESQIRNGAAYVARGLRQTCVAWPEYDANPSDDEDGGGALTAPINGRIAKLAVTRGAQVEKGALVAVIEAMKMEHLLVAPRAGIVETIPVSEGEQVNQGALIATIAYEADN